MKVIKIADGGTVTIELTATEVTDVHKDIDAAEWGTLTDSAKALYHFLDMTRAAGQARTTSADRAGIFPGGGF